MTGVEPALKWFAITCLAIQPHQRKSLTTSFGGGNGSRTRECHYPEVYTSKLELRLGLASSAGLPRLGGVITDPRPL